MYQLVINDLEIEVSRKNIKNIHLTVYPPHGKVRISAPWRMNDQAIQLFVIPRLAWIKKHQAKFLAAKHFIAHEYLSGENHAYLGQTYLLNVIHGEGHNKVILRNDHIMDLYVNTNSNFSQRQQTLYRWYRQQLHAHVPPLINKWEKIIGVQITDWRVKLMKTRWGTCNIKERRIWLNLELIKKPLHCLEYIIVHELVHLLERRHNARFKNFMDQFLPQWRQYNAELSRLACDAS